MYGDCAGRLYFATDSMLAAVSVKVSNALRNQKKILAVSVCHRDTGLILLRMA